MAEKPAVLIIGGLGYIGRFLALHIHKNNLASEVRIVDKVLPQLAWLAPEFEEACSKDKFVQADASKERMSIANLLLHIYVNAFVLGILADDYSRISSPYLRSPKRQAMGLRFQLWRRDQILARGRGV